MSPAIEALILSICTLTLRISAAGAYHAHFDFSPHCAWISIHVYQASHEYSGKDAAPALLNARAPYKPASWEILSAADAEARSIARLEALRQDVEAYLPKEQEAAA